MSQMAAMSIMPTPTQATQQFVAREPFQVTRSNKSQHQCSNNHSTWVLSTPDAQRDVEVAVEDADGWDKEDEATIRPWIT
jgi:hypothetical protein